MDKLLKLGANYYPEDWDENELEGDIKKMLELGMKVVRIGEFAWAKDEPVEGQVDFSWMRRVMDAMHEAGIGVILGTPSATPPHWLVKKHPDMRRLMPDGTYVEHGGRRHCCSNHPEYRAHSLRICRAMAEDLGRHPALIGWQIDNEIYAHDIGCVCPHCMAYFHNHLKNKYHTIEELNARWNLNLFSQRYDAFEDIPAPIHTWHNPHLVMEWDIAQNAGHVEFVSIQADCIRPYSDAPIGTDTMPVGGMDYRVLSRRMDVSQFNHYNTPESINYASFWMDYMRGYSHIPFWNTETQPCWNGSTTPCMTVLPEGYIRLNSMLPMALGGEMNLYWLWRTHWAGHELMHGALLDTSGRPVYTCEEIKRTAKELEVLSPFLTGAEVKTDVAIQFTSLNWNLAKAQCPSALGNYAGEIIDRFYKPLNHSGLHPDIIDSYAALDGYKMLISPLTHTLEEGDFPNRVTQWVKDGGIWIVGPMSDIRTCDGTKYKDRPYGILEELTGARQRFYLPAYGGAMKAKAPDGSYLPLCHTFETFDLPRCAEVLAQVDHPHSAIDGLPCVAKIPVGKGWVILLGALPDPSYAVKLFATLADENGIAREQIMRGDLIAVRRENDKERGLALCNMGEEEGAICLKRPMQDMENGKIYSGELVVAPFDVRVLREIAENEA